MQIKILFYENKYSMIALSRVNFMHQILQKITKRYHQAQLKKTYKKERKMRIMM